MEDVTMFCNDSVECPCEDICCQECNELSVCDKKCDSVKYKEKIYESDEFLINQLEELAEKEDNWLIAVAVEKIRELRNACDIAKSALIVTTPQRTRNAVDDALR